MPVEHSPRGQTKILPAVGGKVVLQAPKDGIRYSKEEVEAMNPAERLWYDNHRDRPECQEDLIGYDEDLVGQMKIDPPGNPEPEDPKRFGPAPPVNAEPIQPSYKTEPLKVLKYWPEEHPKFKGLPGDNAVSWLGRLAVHLHNRGAHPAIWHKVGGL
ncbi:hypothetical protein PTTG_04009 [Puccinia triticina 1-1 BBBD Race 1]|uniref:Uncharacterized protein n=1 Tax=Puccinia triticina (isolate 1-1 / race 1 (BBBD)) TaxID=630390 RepID=A0A180G0W7_PUCT1|nr:hypothetical protein PTTG_04009 [Puccinia triticina 1-1 BBBD Race 1]